MALKPETKAKLMTVSTATLCTALFKRGLRNQFIQDVRPLNRQPAQHGGRGVHAALHPCARRPEPHHRVPGPQRTPSAWLWSNAPRAP
jgi:hypothetical protein